MGERLTKRQIAQEVRETEKVLHDSGGFVPNFVKPLELILGELSPSGQDAVELALVRARLAGRLEGYNHALDADVKPVIIDRVEQWLRNGDIIVHQSEEIRIGDKP